MPVILAKILLCNKQMGFLKEEKPKKLVRLIKTIFFLITMILSLLVFSAPVFLVVADAILPSALLSASISSSANSLSLQTLPFHFRNYDFRYSLIDIPFISLIRSAVILCVYSLCDGPKLSRGPYLSITAVFSISSLMFVSLKASYMFSNSNWRKERGGYAGTMEVALFACSLALAIGHTVVAYRTSCRERRKLLVYRIDIEAISASKMGFPRYQQKLLQEERVK